MVITTELAVLIVAVIAAAIFAAWAIMSLNRHDDRQ
jgi:hypothetical protein